MVSLTLCNIISTDITAPKELEPKISDRKGRTFRTKCSLEKDRKLLTNLCNNPVIFDQFKTLMEQMKVFAIMKLQTELFKLAPEFEITPKRKENPKNY